MIRPDFRIQIGLSETDREVHKRAFLMADIFTCTGGANDANDGSAPLSTQGAMPVSQLA